MPYCSPQATLAIDAFAHFEHLAQAVLVTDAVLSPPGPRILYANPAFERMTGWSREEIIGRTPRILQGPESDRASMGELKAALKRGESWAGETTNYRRDGTPFIMKWTVAPVLDPSGSVQRYVAIQEDVTERRAAKRREKRLNGLTRQLMAVASEGIIVTDAEQRVTALGAGAASIFGWREDEIRGWSISTLIPTRYRGDHAAHMATFARADDGVRPMAERREVACLHRDGHEFPAMVTVARLGEHADDGFIAVVRDLSIRKAQARKLAESERRYRAVFDLTYQFVGLLTVDGWVVEANQTSLAFFGGDISDVRGKHFLETPWFYGNPEARQKMHNALETAAGGNAARGHLPLRAPDGGNLTLDFSVRPVLDTDGNVEYLLPEGRDITDLIQSGKALQAREAELKEAQRIARMGDWRWDIPSGQLFWSDESYRIFGFAPEKNPTYERFLSIVHPEDRDTLVAAVEAALAGEAVYTLDHRVVLPDGRQRVLHEQAEVLRDDDGRPVEMVGIVQDVTERKLMEQALLDAKRDAETANEAKSRFLSTMGHELRTPLNAVNGFSQLIADETFGSVGVPQYREYAQLIQQSGEHLLDIINTILDATRVESGRMDLADDWFDAPSFLRQTVELARAESRDFSIQIGLNNPPPITLLADRRLLRQALLNLIGNAVKFSPGGSTVTVEASLSPVGVFEITVRDDGPGIPADAIDQVTLPFYQADDGLSRRHEGSGLGLYLAKSFIKLHEGDLDLQSESGGGTLATLKLPRCRVHS